MKITTSVTVPDYVFLFYQKTAEALHISTAEELMARTLMICAGTLSQEILNDKIEL